MTSLNLNLLKDLFLYFCWLVLIVLSLLCRFLYCTLVLTTHLE